MSSVAEALYAEPQTAYPTRESVGESVLELGRIGISPSSEQLLGLPFPVTGEDYVTAGPFRQETQHQETVEITE
ncbi:MAG: hypothetical protein JWO96_537 [Candidatus Saccharibacteria bacterium]|nr:hypothetical protein [Candidatus Saccharibacteria bacterium]